MPTRTTGIRRRRQTMPGFVKQALEAKGLASAYAARPAYQRNDYLGWINAAKREETKQKRLGIMLRELKGGSKYMNMAWTPRQAPAQRRTSTRKTARRA
jgi:uncharacterized protein YdeI (YjbR/CyaY-like superfamily)